MARYFQSTIQSIWSESQKVCHLTLLILTNRTISQQHQVRYQYLDGLVTLSMALICYIRLSLASFSVWVHQVFILCYLWLIKIRKISLDLSRISFLNCCSIRYLLPAILLIYSNSLHLSTPHLVDPFHSCPSSPFFIFLFFIIQNNFL